MEVVADGQDIPGSRNDAVFLENLPASSSFIASTLDHSKLGLEDYVLKHGSGLTCDSCFPNRDDLRSGSEMVCEDKHKTTKLVVETAVMISEVSNLANNCFGARCSDTEVLCFKDFAPCSISEAFLKALTGIDKKRYGLPLECAIDQISHLVAEATPLVQQTRFDKKLIRKAIELALDDFKNKYAGFLLSADTLKVDLYFTNTIHFFSHVYLFAAIKLNIKKSNPRHFRFAPDFAKAIAGLISYSNDMDFKKECLAILGLQPHQSEGEIVGETIKN
ncbi:unnamed protein product [Citrullus colocynthis]|uniref:Uncharacterized protein n=1 Tax=Citrullus colocynthis TaxID=252529 RepID=A0ABP0XVZ9_9ROSI